MDDASQRFIEKMGLLYEADGMPRIAGRILGLLLLRDEVLSLDDLAEELRISKASASVNARQLERVGALERVAKPGDRRDYYGVAEGMAERMLEIRLDRVSRLRSLLEEGLATVEVGSSEVRERLEEVVAFHCHILADLRRSLSGWQGCERGQGERREGERREGERGTPRAGVVAR